MGGHRQVVTKERHGRRGNEGEDRTTMIGLVGHGPRSSRCSDKQEGVEWLSTDGPVGGKPLASGGGRAGDAGLGSMIILFTPTRGWGSLGSGIFQWDAVPNSKLSSQRCTRATAPDVSDFPRDPL